MQPDLWEVVMEKAKKQQAKGLAKYGCPVTADDTVNWLDHAIEEHLDAAVYLEAAKSVIAKQEERISDLDIGKFQLTEKNKALLAECAEWEQLYSNTEKELRKLEQSVPHQVEALQNTLIERDHRLLELEEDLTEKDIKIERLETYLKRANANTADALSACKRLEASKERAEKDTAAVLNRLKEYHRSEGNLALVAATVSLCVGLLLGYLMF